MYNQTKSLLSTELFFTIDRLAAIFSLLFILILILIIFFLLFFQQRNLSVFDEHEIISETDATIIENKALELANVKLYASMNNNPSMIMTTSISSFQTEIEEDITQSTTNLVSSK